MTKLISRVCAYCGLEFTETLQPPTQLSWWRCCPRCSQHINEDDEPA